MQKMSTVAPVVYELWVIEVTYMIFDFLKKIKVEAGETGEIPWGWGINIGKKGNK